MGNELSQITELINNLEDIHMDHISSFNMELMPDLEKQSIERSKIVDKLGEKIHYLINNINFKHISDDEPLDSDTDYEAILLFKKRIFTLLEQNRALEKKVRAHKDSIQKSMKKVSKGRQAINSYGSSTSVKNRAQVMNLTG